MINRQTSDACSGYLDAFLSKILQTKTLYAQIMVRINAEVEEDTRDKWKSHSRENPKYNNMTHLIRTAITNQIAFDEQYGGAFDEAISGGSSDISEDIEKLKEDLNETLISLQNDINQIQIQAQGTESETLLREIMGEFHDMLPRYSEEVIHNLQPSEAHVDTLINTARAQSSISSDIDEMDCRKALEELVEKVPTVESTVIEQERFYYEQN